MLDLAAAKNPRPSFAPVAGAQSAYALFCRLSRVRGRRFFHPAGVAYRGRLVSEGEPGALAIANERHDRVVVLRFSRALGVPRPLPDFLGLALRIFDAHGPGAHQDLLFASAWSRGPLRAIPRPATTFFGPSFSTLLPYRVAGRRAFVGAVAQTPRRGSNVDTLTELVETAERGGVRFAVVLAHGLGDWQRVGVVAVEARLSQEESRLLRFNPVNTGGGLELAGWANRIRDPAYRGSQTGRAQARGDPGPSPSHCGSSASET